MLKRLVQIVMGAITAAVSQDSRATVRSANVYLALKETTVTQILMNVRVIYAIKTQNVQTITEAIFVHAIRDIVATEKLARLVDATIKDVRLIKNAFPRQATNVNATKDLRVCSSDFNAF